MGRYVLPVVALLVFQYLGTPWHSQTFIFFFFFLSASRYEADLNPVDHQKASVLKYQMEKRPFFEMPSHLADVDVDEYDYDEDFE